VVSVGALWPYLVARQEKPGGRVVLRVVEAANILHSHLSSDHKSEPRCARDTCKKPTPRAVSECINIRGSGTLDCFLI